MSSSSSIEQAVEELCASCGVTGKDDEKLKLCTACKLVKYCSVECQKNHRSQHKKPCKKRAAEIRDDNLFRQPDESHYGECTICFLPHSLDGNKSMITSCCCEAICNGCNFANFLREKEQGLEPQCPYCREPVPKTGKEIRKRWMKRIKANDPVAHCQMGSKCHDEGDYEGAVKYWKKAAALGDVAAHYNLSNSYHMGEGVEKDNKKEIYHLEEASIGGHPKARYNLGCEEQEKRRIERAMKHWIIAANLGHDNALKQVKEGFKHGLVSKEDFAAALRGHQAAVDATKSAHREKAGSYSLAESMRLMRLS